MRRIHCLNILSELRDVSGDVIELGVGFGGVSLPLALWLLDNAPEKRLFACDTFSGLPDSEGELSAGEWDFGESFHRAVEQLPLGNVRVIRGRIEDTLTSELSEHRFCFAFLDLDLYLPTSGAAAWLTDRIASGGVLGFHDYRFDRCPGVAKVADAELDRNKFDPLFTADNCAFFRRM